MLGSQMLLEALFGLLEQADGLVQPVGCLIRGAARLLRIRRVWRCSAPRCFSKPCLTCSNRRMASSSLPAAWYAAGEEAEHCQGLGVVAPSVFSQAGATSSNKRMASDTRPASGVRAGKPGKCIEHGGVVGPQDLLLGPPGHARKGGSTRPACDYSGTPWPETCSTRACGMDSPQFPLSNLLDLLEQSDRLGQPGPLYPARWARTLRAASVRVCSAPTFFSGPERPLRLSG